MSTIIEASPPFPSVLPMKMVLMTGSILMEFSLGYDPIERLTLNISRGESPVRTNLVRAKTQLFQTSPLDYGVLGSFQDHNGIESLVRRWLSSLSE